MPETPSQKLPEDRREEAAASKPLDYWRSAVAARRRWFGVDANHLGGRIITNLKTLAWVLPLTVLIWIYAEREQQTTQSGVPVQIHVRINSPNKLVKLEKPPEGMVLVELYGPRAAIDRVERELHVPGEAKSPVVVQVPANLEPGTTTSMTILNDLASNPLFTSVGVKITNVSPPEIWVAVDKWEERDLPVKAPPGLETLNGEPIFSPATIKVRAPASVFAKAAQAGAMQLTADLGKLPELTEPGTHQISHVPVTWTEQDQDVTISPSTVDATIDVKQRDEKYTIASVPIWVCAPPSFLDNYQVKCPLSLANVLVSGPPEKIAIIRNGGWKEIKARLDVSTTDLTGDEEHEKALEFENPYDGVRVVGDSASEKVTFTIVSRKAGE